MPLSFSLHATQFYRDAKGRCYDAPEWPVVSTIIQLTPVIGVGTFTPQNMDEVVARIRFLEKLSGGFLTTKGKEVPIPEPILRSLLHLKTNVAHESRARFTKRAVDVWFADTLRAFREG